MGHDHTHEGGHAHGGTAGSRNKKRLAIVLGLTSSYLVVEVIGGLLSHSLALLAEAAHMFTDVAALAMAFFAIRFAERPPTPERTYGYNRMEILAALANAVFLITLSGLILFEAVQRLRNPPEVHGKAMFLVASFGLVINAIGILVLRAGAAESLNVKAAYFEVLSDALSAVGVILAGAVVWATGWYYADPLVSAGIGLFILPRTWSLLKEAVGVLLEGTPAHVDLDALRKALEAVPGVMKVHDLHVWTITSGMHAMSAHAVVTESASNREVLAGLRQCANVQFKIGHATLQLEDAGCEDPEAHA
jgi:cobalt-zinc-cadmium efflux system protein